MSDKEILIQAAEILYRAREAGSEMPDETDMAAQILIDEVKDNW